MESCLNLGRVSNPHNHNRNTILPRIRVDKPSSLFDWTISLVRVHSLEHVALGDYVFVEDSKFFHSSLLPV